MKKAIAVYMLIFLLLVLSSYSPSCPAYESYTDSDNKSSSSSAMETRPQLTDVVVLGILVAMSECFLFRCLVVLLCLISITVGKVSIIKLEVGFPLADPDLIDENDIRFIKRRRWRTLTDRRVKMILSSAVRFLQDTTDDVSWAACSVQTLKYSEWYKNRGGWSKEHIRLCQEGENILVTLLIAAKGEEHKLPTAGSHLDQDMLQMALQQISLIDPSNILDLDVIRTYAGIQSV